MPSSYISFSRCSITTCERSQPKRPSRLCYASVLPFTDSSRSNTSPSEQKRYLSQSGAHSISTTSSRPPCQLPIIFSSASICSNLYRLRILSEFPGVNSHLSTYSFLRLLSCSIKARNSSRPDIIHLYLVYLSSRSPPRCTFPLITYHVIDG